MRRIILLIIFVFFIFPVFADHQQNLSGPNKPLNQDEASVVIKKIREFQKDIDTITARVLQKKRSRLIEKDIDTEGTITLKKPRFLRWEIEKPERIIIVVDGESTWVYDPVLKEVQHSLFSESMAARFAIDFISSSMEISINKLEKKFEVIIYDSSENYVLELRPKSKIVARYLSAIYIWHRKKDGIPVRFEVIGRKDDITITTFSNIQINPDIEKDLFNFEVPEGVRVIE